MEVKEMIAIVDEAIDVLSTKIHNECEDHYGKFIFGGGQKYRTPYDVWIDTHGKEDYDLVERLRSLSNFLDMVE